MLASQGQFRSTCCEPPVRAVAAAALLARHWPGPDSGQRQNAALALAGGLARAGWTGERVSKFIAAVATAARDDEATMRVETAERTCNRIAASQPATGWPKLAEIVGDLVVGKVRDWLAICGNGKVQCGLNPTSPVGRGLATTCLASVPMKPVRYLVPGFLPCGKLVLMAGDGGNGKSVITLDLAACLSAGRPCFGLNYPPPPPADVLLVSCEDGRADTIVPRLHAAGADLNHVHHLDGIRGADGKVLPFSLAHYQQLQEHLEDNPSIRLVVIDPAGAYIGRSGVNDHQDSELRSLLGPLCELAEARDVTILLIKHLHKGATARAVHKVSGSTGYVNAVRAAFLVAPDPDQKNVGLFLPLKFNTKRPKGLRFQTVDLTEQERKPILDAATHLGDDDRRLLAEQFFRVQWIGETTTDADTALAKAEEKARERLARDVDRAAEWLLTFLKDRPRRSVDCVERGNQALRLNRKLDWWQASVLKKMLEGGSRKTGRPMGRQTWWFVLSHHPWPFPGLEDGEDPEDPEGPEDRERYSDTDSVGSSAPGAEDLRSDGPTSPSKSSGSSESSEEPEIDFSSDDEPPEATDGPDEEVF